MSEASLDDLPFLAFLDDSGNIPAELSAKIGVYAIFDAQRSLQYVGISRDIASSLKLHLVRVPDRCYWLKIATVAKPSRTVLSEMQAAWLEGKSLSPEELSRWEQPLDCRPFMNDAEKQLLANAATELDSEKVLKNVARRIEDEILAQLAARGVAFDVRFNPKLKSLGILDVK